MKLTKTFFSLILVTTLLTGCGDKTPETTKNPETTNEVSQEVETEAENEQTKDTSNELIADAPTYKVGVIPDFEPYAFRGTTRSFTGFNIDLTNAIAAAEQFNVQYLDKKWSPTFESVQNGKVDFIASIVTITPERDEMVDFSDGYISSGVDAVVKKDLVGYSFNQLVADKSLKFSAMGNTRFVDYIIKLGIDEKKIKASSSSFTSVSNVLNGNVDVAVADAQSLKYYQAQYPEINIVKNPKDVIEYAYVVKTGNVEMQDILNSGLAKVKANGQYDKIYEKWFGDKQSN